MKKWSKRSFKLFLCSLLSLLIVAGATPMVFAAGADTEEPLDTGSKILALDQQKPKELDNMPDNVYDVNKGQNFLLSEQNELMLLVRDSGVAGTGQTKTYLFDDFNFNVTEKDQYNGCWINGINVKNAGSTDYLNTADPANNTDYYKNMYAMQSVSADLDGTGRKNYAVSVGFDMTEKKLRMVVQNAVTGTMNSFIVNESVSHAYNSRMWMMDNFLSITAGDYDGNGKDSVVIYICGNGDNAKLVEFTGTGTSLTRREVLNLSSVLENKEYQSQSDYYYKPAVTLTTGDFTGDGRDQLAFSAGFYNTSGNVTRGYQNYSCSKLEQFASCVGVCDYTSSGWQSSAPVWMYERSDDYTSSGGDRTYPVEIMHAASISAGDVNNDGVDEIVAVGYASLNKTNDPDKYARAVYNNDKLKSVSGICDWSDELTTSVIRKSGKTYSKTSMKRIDMGLAQKWPYQRYCREEDRAFARLAIACAKTNGNNQPEEVFIAGMMFDFSKYTPQLKYVPRAIGGKDVFNTALMQYVTGDATSDGENIEVSVFWVESVAVGNFNGNDAGREQFVFTVWGKWKGEDKYSANVGVIAGVEFNDTTGNDSQIIYGGQYEYACNMIDSDMVYHNRPIHGDNINATQLVKGAPSNSPINTVPVAVDIDNDGVVGRFSKKGYVYTDPEVMAVLEAAPYFEEIDELGGYADPCETSYTISTGYGTGTSRTDNVSFEVGLASEVAGPGVKSSLELGYCMDWSNTYEKSFTKTYSNEFTAKGQDVVVISRIPQLVYTYDIYNPQKGDWDYDSYNVRVPMAPRVYKLSIKEYNKFVDQYNKLVKNDNKYTLQKIVMGTDLPEDHEGNPSNYWNVDWKILGGTQLSKNQYNLDHTGGATACQYSEEAVETESEEMSHGFHFGLTVQGGASFVAGEAWAGGYTNLDYSQSTGHSTTSVNTTESGGKVEDINAKAIKLPGLTTEEKNAVIDKFTFAWTFGKMEKQFVKNGPDVPIYGYVVTDVGRPTDINNVTIGLSPKDPFTYNGKVQKPTIKTIGGNELKAGRDYKAVWSNGSSQNAGAYKVTIYGLNGYIGTASATYKIAPKAVNPAVTLSKTAFTYNGKAQKPTVTVKYGTTTLRSGTDYTVTWPSNVTAAGTKNVKVTLKGNYSGTKTVSYTINKAANRITASNFTKTASASGAQTFAIGATRLGGARLTYASNNSNVTVSSAGKVTIKKNFSGKATITIKAAATTNYNAATKKITVTVNPSKTAIATLKNTAAKTATVTWKKNTTGSGYQIQYSTDKTFKSGVKSTTVTKNTILSRKLTSLTKGKTYYVRMRTVKTVSSYRYLSAWSAVKYVKITK